MSTIGSSLFDFVQLDRTFHELSKHTSASDDIDMSQALWGPHLTWESVLANFRTVILSEAGSGKTQEIKHAAAVLRDQGKSAFFLRLELVVNEFEHAFEVGTAEQFAEWVTSTDDGWLLLDSVDEARLRGIDDFEKAVRKIGKLIVPAKDRVRIILTGRSHAWRAKTDLAFCQQHLGFAHASRVAAGPSEPDVLTDAIDENGDEFDITDNQPELNTQMSEVSEPTFKVIALNDLTKEQIARFAEARGR